MSCSFGGWLLIAFTGLLFASRPVSAQFLLRPNGQQALPPRPKSLAAEVTIDRQFATTKLALAFEIPMEIFRPVEADFIYSLQPGSVVTDFAYWNNNEKVAARIVEKHRADEVYHYIKSHWRDPALIERIAPNAFRARIFPLTPGQELKVEMTLVQALPSDSQGVFYELPLREAKGLSLDALNVNVRVLPDASVAKVTENYGLPATQDSDGWHVTLSGSHYRPPKDLRINLVRHAQPLHAALYAAPSGGPGGFFALALQPERSLNRPSVRIAGVRTYQVLPVRLPGVKAYHTLLLVGRYKGSGPATVTLEGNSPAGRVALSTSVFFGAEREPNNIATKLWAARRIEQLSVNAADRSTLTALSLRFGLPSRFTSWLAIPDAEKRWYWERKNLEAIHRIAEQIAAEFLRGRGSSHTVQVLRQRFDDLSRQIGRDPRGELRSELDQRAYQLARALVSERHQRRPNRARMEALEQRLHRLTPATGKSTTEYLQWAELPWVEREAAEVREQLLAELRKDPSDPQRLRLLEERFTFLNRKLPKWSRDPAARTERLAVKVDIEKLDHLIVTAKQQADATRLEELQRRHAGLKEKEEALRVRMGDPLLRVEAPADAAQVVALMPDGTVKPLAFDPASGQWEARFDIPVYAPEGEYAITVIFVLKDGTRKVLTVRYHVDLTPPQGIGQARVVDADGPALRLELVADEDTARATALLPWGESVALHPAAQPHHYFALVPIPPGEPGAAYVVTFVLTDRAHNRTCLTVDLTR